MPIIHFNGSILNVTQNVVLTLLPQSNTFLPTGSYSGSMWDVFVTGTWAISGNQTAQIAEFETLTRFKCILQLAKMQLPGETLQGD